MASAPPNDDELDGLLDDAFAQFDTPLPKQQSQTQKKKPADTQRSLEPLTSSKSTDKNASSDDTNFEEEFARQLAKGMEDLLKESSGSDADSNVNESEMKAAIDQLLKQMGTLQSDLASSSDKEAEKPDSAPKATASLPQQGAAQVDEKSTTDSSGDAQAPSFQDKIKATMDKLKESADRADAETQGGLGDMDMLEELMRQMDGGGDDTQLDSLVDDVIGQLMSKEVLEQPLKDLDKQYPKYLDENKASLSTEDYERYQKQHDYIKQILALFEKLDDDSVNNELVVELMQKMQDCGQPPKELLKTLAPDMELDENGEVKVPEMPNCTIM